MFMSNPFFFDCYLVLIWSYWEYDMVVDRQCRDYLDLRPRFPSILHPPSSQLHLYLGSTESHSQTQ